MGNALTSRFRHGHRPVKGSNPTVAQLIHTTEDLSDKGPSMQSILETNDLLGFMELAEISNRDFTGEHQNSVVLTNRALQTKDMERSTEQRAEAEKRHADALRIPRRPPWTKKMTPEILDSNEREAFLQWRRRLAAAEEEENLVLTPFEKNLDVWRQLWRVLERSDVVVQIVDARDPLRYRSVDLENYCRELDSYKETIIVLNKSDLLPARARKAWADYFDQLGLPFLCWSAYEASEDAHLERTLLKQVGYQRTLHICMHTIYICYICLLLIYLFIYLSSVYVVVDGRMIMIYT